MTDNEQTIEELVKSINDSITDMREHPVEVTKLPSNFEILVKGVTNSKAIDFLFSTKLDSVMEKMFNAIQSGDFSSIIENKESIEGLVENIFGKGSFQGPVSQTVLNSVQASMMSYKYQTMKSHLGKTMTTLKKMKFIMKNLEKQKSQFKGNPEEYKKYKDAVYAIKQTLKFAAKIYRNRRIINDKVYRGLNNVVHEEDELFDEGLE